MMNQKQLIAWGFIFLLVFSALPLAFAETQALSLNAYWDSEVEQEVVEQGQPARFSVNIVSQSQSRLSVNILRSGRIVQRIRDGQIVPTGRNNPFYFTTLQIDTNNMAGDYVVEIIAVNSQGSSRRTLALSVERAQQELPSDPNNDDDNQGADVDHQNNNEENWQDSMRGEPYNNPRFASSSQIDLGIDKNIIGFVDGILADNNNGAGVEPRANPDPRIVPNVQQSDFNVNDIVPPQGIPRNIPRNAPLPNDSIDEGVEDRIIPPEDEAVGENPLNDQEPIYVPNTEGEEPLNDQEPIYVPTIAGEDPINDVENDNDVIEGENSAPVLITPAVLEVEEGQTITFRVEVFDANGDEVKVIAHENCGEGLECLLGRVFNLVLGLNDLPDTASYQDATRTFTYTPEFDTVELFGGQKEIEFQFIGYDGQDYSQWAITTIIVHDRRHFNPQPVPPQFLPEDPVIPEIPEDPEQPQPEENGENGTRVGAIIATAHVSSMAMVGSAVRVSVNVDNTGSADLENLRVRVIIPNLGISASTSNFDLDVGENKQKTVSLPIPVQARQGLYLVRIIIENEEFRETAHRYVTIVR